MKPLPAFLRDPAGFLVFVFRRWGEDRCQQIAGSLTFTTLLALVPFIAVVVAVITALPYFEDAMVQVKIFLLMNLVPEIAGKVITVHMVQFAEAAGRLTTVSLIALFIMAIMMLFTVDRSMNAIWRVDSHRPLWLSMTGYATLIALGPVLIGMSLWATSWLVAASLDRIAMPSQVGALALRVLPIVVSAFAFFLVYRIIPNRHVPWRHALAGGIVAAVLFELMKSTFAAYLRAMPTYRLVYGAFASIPIFMLWVYLSWMVILFGAEFTASLAYWRGRLWRRERSPEADLRSALELGRALATGGPGPVPIEVLRESVDLPYDQLEDLLNALARTGAVRRQTRGWVLGDTEEYPAP